MFSDLFQHLRLPATALSLCLATSAHGKHYRVYLLGGQSNGNGRGDASELSVPPLDTEGLASEQTNVRFYWHKTQSTPNGNLPQNKWLNLQPDTGHGVNNPSSHAVEFGPELTFGKEMAAADPAVNIAIIKYTHGGTNLHTQWNEGGVNYTTFVTTVSAGLNALTTAGDTYEIGGMVWVQGESDTSGVNAPNYETNLRNLIERVRRDVFGGPMPGAYTMPFLISGLSDQQYSNITTAGSGPAIVRQAQEIVAATERQAAFVNTDGLPTYSNGAVHFNATAQIAIGKACAMQMLSLENNDADRDGLLLSEENRLGTNPEIADSDGDGQSDGLEAVAGTDPRDGTSFFGIIRADNLNQSSVSLTWPSVPGNEYSVEVSHDLIDWKVIASNLSASAGPTTTWEGAAGEPTLPEIASYQAPTAMNGNFNTNSFDSVDTHPDSVASRLFQGGSLNGGGSASFVLGNAVFNSSDSGSPGFNLADADTSNRNTGDSFGFSIQPNGNAIAFETLSFFCNQFGTSGKLDVSYTVGDTETFILENFTPPGSNVPVTKQTLDFANFSSNLPVTWTFYLYGASNPIHGTRFDDILLLGEPVSPPAMAKRFFRINLH